MNYIKESEEILKNYRKLNSSLNYLQNRKNKIVKKGFPRDVAGIQYDKPAIQHQDYSESTINQMCEIMEINSQIEETQSEMELVSDILKEIKKEDELLYKFIQLKYITDYKKSMKEIAVLLNYSENSNHTIYDIKNRAVKEFSILYFGAKGIKYT
jgi:hypothetical protein